MAYDLIAFISSLHLAVIVDCSRLIVHGNNYLYTFSTLLDFVVI